MESLGIPFSGYGRQHTPDGRERSDGDAATAATATAAATTASTKQATPDYSPDQPDAQCETGSSQLVAV